MRQALIVLPLFLLFGCNQQTDNSPPQAGLDSVVKNLPIPEEKELSFLDSVMARLDLSYDQMRAHTTLDSFMYKKRSEYGGVPLFRGDTVYFADKEFPIVIIDYSDGLVCSQKYLLAFRLKGMKSLDYKEVEINCDQDQSAEFFGETKFEIVNDSSFNVMDFYYPNPEVSDSTFMTVTTQRCVVKDGKIEVRKTTEERKKVTRE